MASPTPPAVVGRLVAARAIKDLAKEMVRANAATASGLWGSSVSAVVAGLRAELRRPVVLICGHLDEAYDLADDVELFAGQRPDVLPALELAGSLGRYSDEQVSNRLQPIARLAACVPCEQTFVPLVQSLMQPVPSLKQLHQLIRTINPGDE